MTFYSQLDIFKLNVHKPKILILHDYMFQPHLRIYNMLKDNGFSYF